MKELTDRQKQLLLYIENHSQIQGFPPSIREMADHMGIRSTNGVNDHLKALEKKGYISRGQGPKSRAISIVAKAEVQKDTGSPDPIVAVPVLGRVAAGIPILADENIEDVIYVGQSLIKSKHRVFALRVTGDSMIEKGIFDGDIVFVKSQESANNGQIVVALLDGEATVKTYKKGRSSFSLIPENSNMDPIVVRPQDYANASILGIVTGVYRSVN